MEKKVVWMLVGAMVLVGAPGTVADELGIAGDEGPVITVNSPDLGDWHAGDVTVEAQIDAEPSLQWARGQIDDDPWQWDSVAPHSWTWDTTQYEDGVHELHLQARDTYNEDGSGGRYASLVRDLRVDNTPPGAEIVSPDDEAVVVLGTTVEVEADDATSGVDRVDFYLDGEFQASDREAPYEWEYDAFLQTGFHEITAVVLDHAGNTAEDAISVFVLV